MPPDISGNSLFVDFLAAQIGNGLVSLTLAVDGSAAASPLSANAIFIFAPFDPTDTLPVNLNLSGWTFTNWNRASNFVDITTNGAVAVNDVIVGTVVEDRIFTLAGDDTLQGGGGVDRLFGGDGNDTFVFAANEAADGEEVDGGSPGSIGGTADRVLVQGTNNFTGVDFESIEQLVFGGAATATFDQFFIDNPAAAIFGNADANALVFELVRSGANPAIDLSQLTFHGWRALTDKIVVLGTKVSELDNRNLAKRLPRGRRRQRFPAGWPRRRRLHIRYALPPRRRPRHRLQPPGRHLARQRDLLRAASRQAGGIGLRLWRPGPPIPSCASSTTSIPA